jgi:CRISPR-associated endonuclease/helicase Cas3
MAQPDKNPRTKGSSFPLELCLAKTYGDPPECKAGVDVFGHCVIVGEVAKVLIEYATPGVRRALFPAGSELIAAAHDVGKICPTFQVKIRRNIEGYRHDSLAELGLEAVDPESEKIWQGHAAVSQAALEECPKYIPEIAGRHHGSPTPKYASDQALFGGKPWQKGRETLIKKLKKYFAADWPEVKDDTQALVLSGLTCVADWIGSGPAFDEIDHVEKVRDLPGRAKAAVENAGFVRPPIKRGLSFKEIFEFDPRPAQARFVEAVSSPGVYVLEAPMGIGKTEAALYAAYQVLAAGKASGLYFALPTRLTSDKIHKRVTAFLDVVSAGTPSRPLLLHSSAYLSQTEMGEEAQPGESWFNARKRGILAPFAVGTIDQALMAVMNVRHGFVRAFGLAGKVVILDEVHSYDSYTGTLLKELVRGLRKLGCTVIILSATLTGERRRELLRPRDSGAVMVSGMDSSYPLISFSTPKHLTPQEIPVEAPAALRVRVRLIHDDSLAVEEALKRAEGGQQVLWIENIVAQAQARYHSLSCRAAECKDKAGCKTIETGLIHSRFVQADRDVNEGKWVNILGPEGKAQRGDYGRILVGTQVLEQSLDIDSDFLVTRLCPTDMLLQRIGRLWRHQDTNGPLRPKGACPEVWILAADYSQALENHREAFEKSAPVYDPYVLLRTLELWEKAETLNLPGDIRRLVEETYRERDERDLAGTLKADLEKKRERLERRAIQNVADTGKTETDSEGKTRYSEEETVDVLLLRSVRKNNDDSISLVLSNGEALELLRGLKKSNKEEWRKRAAILSRHIVTVNEKYAPSPRQKFLDRFKDYVYIGKNSDRDLLRVALINQSGRLEDEDGNSLDGDFELSYNPITGYQANKHPHTCGENRNL